LRLKVPPFLQFVLFHRKLESKGYGFTRLSSLPPPHEEAEKLDPVKVGKSLASPTNPKEAVTYWESLISSGVAIDSEVVVSLAGNVGAFLPSMSWQQLMDVVKTTCRSR